MDTSNLAFMFYGLLAPWLVLALYVATLAARESRLQRELENLKRVWEEKEGR